MVWSFEGKEISTKPVKEQIKHFVSIQKIKQDITNIYIFTIFVTPFSDLWMADFVVSSVGFTTNFIHIRRFFNESEGALVPFEIMMWWFFIFGAVYFLRKVLTQFFLMHVEAEKTSNALTQILDNLPEAVLMLESG